MPPSSEWLSSRFLCLAECPANTPHSGSFSLQRGYTTDDMWANWTSNTELRPTLGPFVLMKLGIVWWWGLVVCCQSHRQHNEHSIRPLPEKKTHVRRGWLSSKYQLPHLSPDEFTSALGLCTCWWSSSFSVHLLQHIDWPLSVNAAELSIYLCLLRGSSGNKTNQVKCSLITKKFISEKNELTDEFSFCSFLFFGNIWNLHWYASLEAFTWTWDFGQVTDFNVYTLVHLCPRNPAHGSSDSKHICLETETGKTSWQATVK